MKMAPPGRPYIGPDDGHGRLRFRLSLVTMTLVTVLATAWCCTLGWVPAIVALMIAKHVLVALLVMGLGLDAPERA